MLNAGAASEFERVSRLIFGGAGKIYTPSRKIYKACRFI